MSDRPAVYLMLIALSCVACERATQLPLDAPETDAPSTPDVPVIAGLEFVRVAVSTHRSCALDADGHTYCWGLDLLSDAWRAVDSPQPVVGLSAATELTLTDSYACARLVSGEVSCWGAVPTGVVGDEGAPVVPPMTLPGSAGAVEIAADTGRICARTVDGRVRCWGSMTDAGGCASWSESPVGVFDLPMVDDARSLSVSGGATCFTREGGSAACYLGGSEPRMIELNLGALRSLSVDHSDSCFGAFSRICAVRESGTVDCHVLEDLDARDTRHEIHNGEPRALKLLSVGGETDYCITTNDGLSCRDASGESRVSAEHAAVARTHRCTISGGEVRCWGDNEWGAVGVGRPSRRSQAGAIPGISDAVSLAAGEDHTCLTRSGGQVVCWGRNRSAQRGWPAEVDLRALYGPRAWDPDEHSHAPRELPGLPAAAAVFADRSRTCTSHVDGRAFCWGQSLTARMNLEAPVEIPDVRHAFSISPGDDSESCAVERGGSVLCWGRGWYGTRAGSERLNLPAPARQVDGDTYRGCARLETGDVYCWGGRVDGSLSEHGPIVPKRLAGVSDAIDISDQCAVTEGHTLVCEANGSFSVVARGVVSVDGHCFIREAGTVACRVDFGTRARVPDGVHEISGVSGAVQLASGADHACALSANGRVSCWGAFAAGRLGDGSRTIITQPTPVGLD